MPPLVYPLVSLLPCSVSIDLSPFIYPGLSPFGWCSHVSHSLTTIPFSVGAQEILFLSCTSHELRRKPCGVSCTHKIFASRLVSLHWCLSPWCFSLGVSPLVSIPWCLSLGVSPLVPLSHAILFYPQGLAPTLFRKAPYCGGQLVWLQRDKFPRDSIGSPSQSGIHDLLMLRGRGPTSTL